MTDPVEEFRAAVEAEFGAPWSSDRTADGFVLRYPLRPALAGELTASDELHVRVVADPGTKAFGFTTRRIAAMNLERERAGWSLGGYRASREFTSGGYTGLRRTMSFRRTPEGLVPNPDAPEDSAGREADLRAVAARLGWTEDGPKPGGFAVVTKLPPKGQLIFIGVFFAVVLLVILGVAIFVVSQVAGAFLR